MENALFIKPFKFDITEAVGIIKQFKQRFPEAECFLLANVLYEDYERLAADPRIDKKFLYCPGIHPFNHKNILKIIFELRKSVFDAVIVFTGDPKDDWYQGYRNARLLAGFLRAERYEEFSASSDSNSFFSDINNKSTLNSFYAAVMNKGGMIGRCIFAIAKTAFLYLLVIFFLLFVKPIIWPLLASTKRIKRALSHVDFFRFFRFKKKSMGTSIAQFYSANTSAYRKQKNEYFVKVYNQEFKTKRVKITLDIWPSTNQSHPHRHFAYFAVDVILNPLEANFVKFDYDWDTKIRSFRNDKEIPVADFWRGSLDTSCLYTVIVTVCDFESGTNNKLAILQRYKTNN